MTKIKVAKSLFIANKMKKVGWSYKAADSARLPFDEEPEQVEDHEHHVVIKQGLKC